MSKRSHREEKLAKLYDSEIGPIWSDRFVQLLLRNLEIPPKAMVLDVGCGTGKSTLELLQQMDAQSRIIAIDPSPAMLDQARTKVGPLAGKRIFFRTENPAPRLSFADDVYDLVVCNAGLDELGDPERAVRDFARVTREGGKVAISLPLAGTFGEFYDIFREVLIKQDMKDALDRLDAHLASYPPVEQAEGWFEDAGLSHVESDLSEFTLLFHSSREFFFSPIIEFGPLAAWKAVAGKGQEMQEVFWHCKAAIDAYFGGSSFGVTVIAGTVRGRKMASEALRRLPDEAFPEEVTTNPVELITAEHDMPAGRDADDDLDDDERTR